MLNNFKFPFKLLYRIFSYKLLRYLIFFLLYKTSLVALLVTAAKMIISRRICYRGSMVVNTKNERKLPLTYYYKAVIIFINLLLVLYEYLVIKFVYIYISILYFVTSVLNGTVRTNDMYFFSNRVCEMQYIWSILLLIYFSE